jgi:hypothetical protein
MPRKFNDGNTIRLLGECRLRELARCSERLSPRMANAGPDEIEAPAVIPSASEES